MAHLINIVDQLNALQLHHDVQTLGGVMVEVLVHGHAADAPEPVAPAAPVRPVRHVHPSHMNPNSVRRLVFDENA
jgi:hypothetical protein